MKIIKLELIVLSHCNNGKLIQYVMLLKKQCYPSYTIVTSWLFNLQIKQLGLRWNEIDEDEAVNLASSLQSMTEINLFRSSINAQGVKAIAAAVVHMESPVMNCCKQA